MPSPFPGMDPFIEMGHWQTFHNRFISAMADTLVPQVRPAYAVDIGQDIYLVIDDGETQVREPDIAVVGEPAGRESSRTGPTARAGGVATLEPIALTIPIPRERRHRFIEVRDNKSRDVITIVELLSPANRIDRGGRRSYLAKRRDILESGINLIELDLMRRGHKLPMKPRMPIADYSAVVCRTEKMPRAAVYTWSLHDVLPDVPVPLADGDPDVSLKLQPAFNEVYDRVGFDYTLPYHHQLRPPIREADRGWLAEVLSAVKSKGEAS
jgi:hypothetical protein